MASSCAIKLVCTWPGSLKCPLMLFAQVNRVSRSHGDPFLCAVVNAPEADEPISDEDRDALDKGLAAADAGDTVSDRDLRAELGI